eukprot:2195523-Lingulodinium_polyedra.AAC.1
MTDRGHCLGVASRFSFLGGGRRAPSRSFEQGLEVECGEVASPAGALSHGGLISLNVCTPRARASRSRLFQSV